MRKSLVVLYLVCVVAPGVAAQNLDEQHDLNKPIPMTVRELAIRGTELIAIDAVEEGIILLKKAIVLAPNYIWAHEQYFSARAYYQSQYDKVRAEYEQLMATEPNNPIYPLVIAETARVPSENVRTLLEKVIKLAPDWAWAHLAKARLNPDGQPELIAAELHKCIQLDETAGAAYYSLTYVLEKGLGKIDEALHVAEKFSGQPEFTSAGLFKVWELRLTNAQGSEESKATLRTELLHRSATTRDIGILKSIRSAYLDLLKDSVSAAEVEKRIRRIDSTWYPERGQTMFIAASTESGISRPLMVANREFSIFHQVQRIDDLEPKERILKLDRLLTLKPRRDMKIYTYQRLLRAAEKVKNRSAFVKFGEALLTLEPNDTGLMSKIALAMADRKINLRKAIRYAQQAERETRMLGDIEIPRNTPPEWFNWSFSDARRRNNHKRQRALALEALGWVHFQLGNYAAAEDQLRQSCAIIEYERNLSHLSESLRKLGRAEEAESASRAAKKAWLESLKRQFVRRPSSDFELQAIAGQKFKLSNLKGKVVLLAFWATWCGPCVEEMPHLVNLYAKYRERGFEVLAISVDAESDRYKVRPFVERHQLTFPVLLDEGIAELYEVKVFPTAIFVDSQGSIRYVNAGFDQDRARIFEAVINELLK